jgi:hypothetical protein
MLDQVLNLLLSHQNGDGGWGAVANKHSNTEVTALAALALRSAGADSAMIDKAQSWLTQRQQADGSWSLNDSVKESASWATALAMIALSEAPALSERAVKAGHWLLQQAGGKPGLLANLILFVTRQKRAVRLNQDLIGWPWTAGNFSWVEPTSYCMLALKKLKQKLPVEPFQERISQAELMIYDRMCAGGGWNYGNAEVYDEQLWPYPETTALALIATQDHRQRNENQISLRTLHELALKADSGLAIAWASICFAVYGQENSAFKQDSSVFKNALVQRFAKSQFLGENKALALALLALGDGARYFRV